MRQLAAVVLAAALVWGCRHRPPAADGAEPEGGPVTLLVVNASLSPFRIYVVQARKPQYLGSILPGHSRCFILPSPAMLYNLGARSLEAEFASPEFQPVSADGWIWELAMNPPADAISLRPIDEPCRA